MQVQGTGTAVNNYTKYSGPIDCALKTLESEGVRSHSRDVFHIIMHYLRMTKKLLIFSSVAFFVDIMLPCCGNLLEMLFFLEPMSIVDITCIFNWALRQAFVANRRRQPLTLELA